MFETMCAYELINLDGTTGLDKGPIGTTGNECRSFSSFGHDISQVGEGYCSSCIV